MPAGEPRPWWEYFGLTGICLGLGLVFATISEQPEYWVRTTGGVIQLVGMGAIGYGIMSVRRLFELPTVPAEALAEMREVLAPTPRHFTLATETARYVATFADALLVLDAPADATDTQRLAVLEKNLRHVRSLTAELSDKMRESLNQSEDVIRAEATERDKADKTIMKTLHRFAVGGIRLEGMGLIWLMLGTCLVTWSCEIASFFKP